MYNNFQLVLGICPMCREMAPSLIEDQEAFIHAECLKDSGTRLRYHDDGRVTVDKQSFVKVSICDGCGEKEYNRYQDLPRVKELDALLGKEVTMHSKCGEVFKAAVRKQAESHLPTTTDEVLIPKARQGWTETFKLMGRIMANEVAWDKSGFSICESSYEAEAVRELSLLEAHVKFGAWLMKNGDEVYPNWDEMDDYKNDDWDEDEYDGE